MKKILMTLMAAMLLLSSTTYAVETSKLSIPMQMTTMSKAEAIQMLKEAGIEPNKIKMLENGEMAETEGEFWQIIAWFFIATVAANAPTRSGQHFKPNRNGYLFTPQRNPVKQAIYW